MEDFRVEREPVCERVVRGVQDEGLGAARHHHDITRWLSHTGKQLSQLRAPALDPCSGVVHRILQSVCTT